MDPEAGYGEPASSQGIGRTELFHIWWQRSVRVGGGVVEKSPQGARNGYTLARARRRRGAHSALALGQTVVSSWPAYGLSCGDAGACDLRAAW